MSFKDNYFLFLVAASDSPERMKYSKTIFWLFIIVIIAQAMAPINGVNSKLNNSFILFIRLDYVAHIAMFTCLSVLFKLAYFPQPGFVFRKEVVYFGIMLFMAFCTEAVQLLVPYRVFNINDLIANFLGVVLSVPVAQLFRIFIYNKRRYLQSGVKETI